jgi:transmembrane sensor
MRWIGEKASGGDADEMAARWFVRLQDKDATAEDWLEFESWLGAASSNRESYARLEQLWAELDDLAPQLRQALAPPAATARPSRRRGAAIHLPTRRRWMVAAAAAAAGVGGLTLVRAGLEPEPWTTGAVLYEAPFGDVREVTLEDGTRLVLNAGSRVAVRFDRNARRVVMSDAEAVFDVTHDPRRPFLIRAGDREVRVVGTEFNLRRRNGRMVLTVRRGLVEVRPAGRARTEPTRIARGEQLTHLEGSGRSILASVDPEEAFGWTAGRLVYRDAPLSEVAADLSRRFGGQVLTADSDIAATRFTGVLVLDEQQAVLERLVSLAPVEVERRADGSVMLRRRD